MSSVGGSRKDEIPEGDFLWLEFLVSVSTVSFDAVGWMTERAYSSNYPQSFCSGRSRSHPGIEW